MYHRFEENKYPSTNIKINDFLNHIKLIKDEKISFIHPNDLIDSLRNKKSQRKILITIDDGFLSFYEKAWPVLREQKIPFILFVSTREVGKSGYMNWDQIREVASSKIGVIGNHSHTHEYLADSVEEVIINDIQLSRKIFSRELKKNSSFFSYPFGEYSLKFKSIVKDLGFDIAFGQHSGVIDETKDLFEYPRFPINEKYGEEKRFKTLLKTLPFKYEEIIPKERYIFDKDNPPEVEIKFFENLYDLNAINCFSNELDTWGNSKIKFVNNHTIKISLKGKFTTERGRINCSLREKNGFYRWLGIQFVIAEK